MTVRVVIVVAATLAVTWLLMIGVFALAKPDAASVRDATRLVPDTVRLFYRLARDPAVPRRARWVVWVGIGYLVFPIDLIPDFVPVVGYADDVVVVALVLRRFVRVAGREALVRNWGGSAAGLAIVQRLAGLESGESAEP